MPKVKSFNQTFWNSVFASLYVFVFSYLRDASVSHLLSTCLDPSGRGEAGAGGRVWLPHREGEAGGAELHSHPDPHPSLHL